MDGNLCLDARVAIFRRWTLKRGSGGMMRAAVDPLVSLAKARSSPAASRSSAVDNCIPKTRAALSVAPAIETMFGIGRIAEQTNSFGFGRDLSQQLEPFSRDFRGETGDAGDIAVGPRQIGNNAHGHSIGECLKDNRYGCGRLLGGHDRRRAKGSNDVDPQTHQLGSMSRELLGLSVRIAQIEGEILALDIAQFAHPFAEGSHVDCGVRRSRNQYA